MTPRQLLIIFARAPELGRVKTRLARTVGDAEALRIYQQLGAAVVAAVTPDADSTRLPAAYILEIAVTPDEAAAGVHAWLGHGRTIVPQGDGDLGQRMAAAIAAGFDSGAERVVVVGTDCPAVDRRMVQAALQALEAHDVVYGPATDGGYYLVGVRRSARARALAALFSNIPWSSDTTLAASLAAARRAELTVAMLSVERDIDTEADWLAYLSRS